ncbi:MAG: hypothetical protein ACHQ01_01655 [Candidatus Limnocylindrales bacterium]
MGREILVSVVGDSSHLQKSLDEATNHVGKFSSTMTGIFQGIGQAGFGLAETGVSKVIGVLGDSDKAFQDAQVSVSALTTAYQNAGVGYAANSDAMQKNLELGNKLGFSSDAQRNSLALLVGVTKDSDDAQNAMNDAMDLARLKHIDLATATDVVTKAMEGNTKGLKGYGIVVTPVTTAVDALKASTKNYTVEQLDVAKAADKASTATATLTDIEKVAGGQASAYADTSAGKLAAAHEKVTEAMVKLGAITDQISQAVLPVLADAFSNLMDALQPVLTELGKDMPGVIEKVRAGLSWITTNVLPPLTEAFNWWVTNILPVWRTAIEFITTKVLPPLATAFDNLLKNFLQPLGKTIGNITSAVLPPLQTAFGIFTNSILPALNTALGLAGDAFTGLGTVVSGVWSGISTVIKGAINVVIGAIDTIIRGIDAIQMHIHFSIPNPLGGSLASMNFDWAGVNLATIPTLHSGGVMPGSPGSEGLALLQAGEKVTPAGKAGATFNITVYNAKPEPASTSVQRELMKLAALGYMGG